MTSPYTQSRAYMDTIVTIQVPKDASPDVTSKVERAFGWFREVEQRCSRFDAASELRRLCDRPGAAVKVSRLLFAAIEFAVSLAGETEGAFDPTLGKALEDKGFNRNYRTGDVASSGLRVADCDYRSVVLDRTAQTVTLSEPVLLDLGAVAKGLAIDLASRELGGLDGYLINAGGDILVSGRDGDGKAWPIGIKDPFEPSRLVSVLAVSDAAVCTSGGYERPALAGEGHHIVSPADLKSPGELVSVTVIAESAMVADALSTAVFVLGRDAGLELLCRQGVEGLLVESSGRVSTTEGV